MPQEIQQKLIEEEMKESYLDYAMSVIVSRALPSVYDGLKPVHRRILFGMHQLSLQYNKPFKKSARIVGEVMGKFHPHGDAAIYDSLVRMAQDFSLRYHLVDGQGNFGSSEDNAASQRYTEARLTKIAEEMLKDIDKDTVDFVPNFDGSLKEPFVLPSKLPNLLINGSSGIAVGMATNIPPHNISEVISALIALIENPNLEIKDLMKYVNGPDFPTAGIILGRQGIKNAYKTGRGKILLRAKAEIENKNIIITEIPYQVNKSVLLESIASLVRDKRVDGISDIRDESDKTGIRVVIKLKQNHNPEVILNQLYKHTSLQVTFGIINLALVDNEPKLLNLKQILECYVKHRKEVITRRTQFDLNKSEARAHILEGLKIALENIDAIVKLIKASKDVKQAETDLMSNFKLSIEQSKAILDMKLQKLTSLETEKLTNEYKELQNLIKELKEILASEQKILNIIKEDLTELKEKYSDERKTFIQETHDVIEIADLIKEEDVVITVTNKGYIKQLPVDTYKQQKRGGQGIKATGTSDGDFVEQLFTTSTHNYLLAFTDKGKVHWIKAYEIPQASRYSKGKAIVNLLNLKDAKVNTIIPVKNFEGYLVLATKNGIIKRTSLEEFSNPRKGGILAITLKNNDELISVKLTSGNDKLIVATRNGLAIRFEETDIREMGRKASGVRAIKLKKEDKAIAMELAPDNTSILTITENGNGKRTKTEEYRMIKRGGVGVINIITNALKKDSKNSFVAGIKAVQEDDEVMFITISGIIIRTSVKDISLIGRNTQGIRLMRLKENDKVTAIAKVVKE